MKGNGMVKTARGEWLNLAELMDKSNAPFRPDPTAQITPRAAPKKVLNVRGHRPGGIEAPSESAHAAMRGEQVVVTEKTTTTTKKAAPAKSLADRTAIKVEVDTSKGTRKGLDGANAALNEILGDLKASTKNADGYKDDEVSS